MMMMIMTNFRRPQGGGGEGSRRSKRPLHTHYAKINAELIIKSHIVSETERLHSVLHTGSALNAESMEAKRKGRLLITGNPRRLSC